MNAASRAPPRVVLSRPAGNESADLGHREWVGLPDGRDAVRAPEPVADLADGAVLVAVGQAVGAVDVVDHADEGAEAGHGEAVGDPLGHEGAHRGGVGRERCESALGAPCGPLLPRVLVDLVSSGRTGASVARVIRSKSWSVSPRRGWSGGPGSHGITPARSAASSWMPRAGWGDVCAKGVVAFVGIGCS